MNKFYKSKKFKYGTASTVISVVVIAAIIVVNVIITALGTANGWFVDMTSQNYFKVSDAFRETFASLMEGEDAYFNIVLMMDEDVFSTYNDTRVIMAYNTFRELAKTYPNIRIKGINSKRYPELVERYKETYGDTISVTDVVFELADENFEPRTDVQPKKYDITAFFVMDSSGSTSSPVGYNAEARILSVFSQLLGKNENRPVAYYLTGHGEPDIDTVEDSWVYVLEGAGYNVVSIDLRTQNFADFYDINSAEDYNNCVVIINDPSHDLYVPSSQSDVNEYKKLYEFFSTGKGNIIVAVDSTTPNLPHLKELLSNFGMSYGGSVSDPQHTFASSDSSKIQADYDRMTEGMASSLVSELFGSRSRSVPTVFESPANVYVRDPNSDSKDSSHGYNGVYGSYSMMYPYASAKVETKEGYEECFLGVYYSTWDVNDADNTRSYAFVIGSTEFMSNAYANTCMNRTVAAWMLSQIYDEMIAFDGINFIRFTDSSSLNVTEGAAQAWTIITIVFVPVAAAAVGTVVWLRRRRL